MVIGGAFLGLLIATGFAFGMFFPEKAPESPALVDLERARSGDYAPTASLLGESTKPLPLEEMAPATLMRRVAVSRGDTLMDLLVDARLTRRESHNAITALSKAYDPRNLKPGQEIYLTLFAQAEESASEASNGDQLLRLALRENLFRNIQVERDSNNKFTAQVIERPLMRELASVRGIIETSLAAAAEGEDLPPNIMIEAIRAFSFDVDFQREVQKGDSFEFFFETYRDSTGRLAKTGELLYGSMTLSGKEIAYYFFEDKDGDADYYDATGQSVRKALLRTPVDGARISSGYGKRKHPISGYTKLHRGVDFAAPRGTPIYAAGKGKVEAAGRNGGYGKYVRIRHNSTYKTAYAHMKSIAKGVKRGAAVRQGQVIGYVGSTGRSTGPHLHYEIHKNGKQVNPLKVRLPSGEKLKGGKLARFQERRAEIDALRGDVSRLQLVEKE